MGILFRKRQKLGEHAWLNISKSGASVSGKLGPLTVNSRGRVTVKLPGGMTWRGKWR